MPGRIQFFYIYGEELQSHKSFFTRLALEYEGRFMGVGVNYSAKSVSSAPVDKRKPRPSDISGKTHSRFIFSLWRPGSAPAATYTQSAISY